jgi:hypothetical protein
VSTRIVSNPAFSIRQARCTADLRTAVIPDGIVSAQPTINSVGRVTHQLAPAIRKIRWQTIQISLECHQKPAAALLRQKLNPHGMTPKSVVQFMSTKNTNHHLRRIALPNARTLRR